MEIRVRRMSVHEDYLRESAVLSGGGKLEAVLFWTSKAKTPPPPPHPPCQRRFPALNFHRGCSRHNSYLSVSKEDRSPRDSRWKERRELELLSLLLHQPASACWGRAHSAFESLHVCFCIPWELCHNSRGALPMRVREASRPWSCALRGCLVVSAWVSVLLITWDMVLQELFILPTRKWGY